MGPGETIGLIAVVVLMIVFSGLIFSAYERRLKHKERKLEFEARIAEAGAARDAAGQQIEDRMRVLERIVTDKGYDVAHQIEALRDARRTETLLDAHDAKVK